MRFVRFEAHPMPEKKVWVVMEHACDAQRGELHPYEFDNEGVEMYGASLICGCRPAVPLECWKRYQAMSDLERAVFVVRRTQEEVTYG